MTKEKLRALFEHNKGQVLSGEKIADELGISRAAVWKGVNALREEGYDIDSIKKKGYYLNEYSDILSVIKLQQYLEVPLAKENIRVYKQIDSTNKQAMIEGLQGEKEWLVILAEEQTKGIAKHNQSFASPKGKGIYLSVLLKPNQPQVSLKNLPTQIGKAIISALEEMTTAKFTFNGRGEVLYEDKKICGVIIQELVERQTQVSEQIVIGIGMNVYGEVDYFGVLEEDNCSLYTITQMYHNRSELVARILNHLYKNYHEGSINSF